MDGREGMSYRPSYYQNRSIGPGNSRPGPNFYAAGIFTHPTPVFKNLSNPNISAQPNVGSSAAGGGGGGGGSVTSQSFDIENPSANFSSERNLTVLPGSGDSVKKKRGRPRKYGPDGANMSLGLSPLSASMSSSGGMSSGEKKPKGRPRGSGWKQKLAPLGEWMNSSAGMAFTPHVFRFAVGEDIAAKILAFAQQRSRALCIMSANGLVSEITLRQPMASGSTVTFEGRFEILCLSGSYLVAESGGPRHRTGGISISVCSPDGQIIGGAVGGTLTAASQVQVVACSFVYGRSKPTKNNASDMVTGDAKHPPLNQSDEQSPTPYTSPNQDRSRFWPQPEVRNTKTDIDLMRG